MKHTKRDYRTSKELIYIYKNCMRRIKILWGRNNKIEAVLYMSLLLECLIKEVIHDYEKIIEGVTISAHIHFQPSELYSRRDIENQTLGYLLKLLDTYTRDKALVRDLNRFNEIRVKCIHKLFEGNLKDVHKLLKGFDIFYYELIEHLLSLAIMQREYMKREFYCVCDECFRKMKEQENFNSFENMSIPVDK